MRVVDTNEMKQIEELAKEEYFFDERLVIENVGSKGADIIRERILDAFSARTELVFLIGPGNNGADGLAIARHLVCLGRAARAFLLFNEETSGEEMRKQLAMAKAYGVKTNTLESADQLASYCSQVSGSLIFVDAIFGTGA